MIVVKLPMRYVASEAERLPLDGFPDGHRFIPGDDLYFGDMFGYALDRLWTVDRVVWYRSELRDEWIQEVVVDEWVADR